MDEKLMIDEHTVAVTHEFCTLHLAKYGYHRLYLVGSRARGTAKPSSDHDFVAVVADDAPGEVLTSKGRNDGLLREFFRFRQASGAGRVDLLVGTASRVATRNPTRDELIPYACQMDGKVMWEL